MPHSWASASWGGKAELLLHRAAPTAARNPQGNRACSSRRPLAWRRLPQRDCQEPHIWPKLWQGRLCLLHQCHIACGTRANARTRRSCFEQRVGWKAQWTATAGCTSAVRPAAGWVMGWQAQFTAAACSRVSLCTACSSAAHAACLPHSQTFKQQTHCLQAACRFAHVPQERARQRRTHHPTHPPSKPPWATSAELAFTAT